MTPTVGRIIHVRADVGNATVRCVAAIVTDNPREFHFTDQPGNLAFMATAFTPHGPMLEAARRLAPIALNSDSWHDPRECAEIAVDVTAMDSAKG